MVRKLNDLYKSSVSSCHCLNLRLQRWLLDKQKLMDRINSITAEKLIFSHAVQMVGEAPILAVCGAFVLESGGGPQPGVRQFKFPALCHRGCILGCLQCWLQVVLKH